MERIVEFALMALIVEITPGPNMAYLASLALAHGRRAGLSAILGVAGGLLAYGILTALGLSALLETLPWLYEALRWAGFAYMIWLSVEAWRGEDASPTAEPRAPPGDRTLLWRGFLVNVLNPKAGIFYLAVLPQFVDPAADHILAWTLGLVAIYVAIATMVHCGIVLGAAAVAPAVARGARSETILRRGLALALVVIALWLLASSRRG